MIETIARTIGLFILSFQIELPDTFSWNLFFVNHFCAVMSSSTRGQQREHDSEYSINTNQSQRQ